MPDSVLLQARRPLAHGEQAVLRYHAVYHAAVATGSGSFGVDWLDGAGAILAGGHQTVWSGTPSVGDIPLDGQVTAPTGARQARSWVGYTGTGVGASLNWDTPLLKVVSDQYDLKSGAVVAGKIAAGAVDVASLALYTDGGTPVKIYDITGAHVLGQIWANYGGAPTTNFLTIAALDQGANGFTIFQLQGFAGNGLYIGENGNGGVNGGDIRLNAEAAKYLRLYADNILWGAGGPAIGSGTRFTRGGSFPASPSTADLHWRTDLLEWFTYDGARWIGISRNLLAFQQRVTFPLAPTVQTIEDAAIFTDMGLWIERWFLSYYIAGTNNGTNYWTFYLFVDDGTTRTQIATFNTSGGVGSKWQPLSATSFSTNPLTAGAKVVMNIDTGVTGSPGSLYVTSGVRFREYTV